MTVSQDDQNGFRFGLETEYLLVDARSFRPLWYRDLSFERLNSALEAIPVEDFQCSSLKVEPPHRKPIPYIVEGYHLPDPDVNPIDLLPKGVEIRTPICNSIDECLAALKTLQPPYAPLRNWGIALAITTVGVITSDLWLDQPIAFFVHRIVADKTIFIWLQRLPSVVLLWLSIIVLAWCGLWALINRPFSRLQSVGLACSISFFATNFVTNQLKYAFGRTWPETWIENNPSLIQNGVFGFNPFHGGPGFASFPSGHVAAVCAVMAVLWWSYPNLRPIYIACLAAVAIG